MFYRAQFHQHEIFSKWDWSVKFGNSSKEQEKRAIHVNGDHDWTKIHKSQLFPKKAG